MVREEHTFGREEKVLLSKRENMSAQHWKPNYSEEGKITVRVSKRATMKNNINYLNPKQTYHNVNLCMNVYVALTCFSSGLTNAPSQSQGHLIKTQIQDHMGQLMSHYDFPLNQHYIPRKHIRKGV